MVWYSDFCVGLQVVMKVIVRLLDGCGIHMKVSFNIGSNEQDGQRCCDKHVYQLNRALPLHETVVACKYICGSLPSAARCELFLFLILFSQT